MNKTNIRTVKVNDADLEMMTTAAKAQLRDEDIEAQLPKPVGYKILVALERFGDQPWCRTGDYVMFRANSGTRFKVDGVEYRLMNDDSIEAVVNDPRGVARAI